jgi:hypothetical protein
VELSRKVIEVTFHPENIGTESSIFTFSGDIELPAKTIKIPQGIGMIIFNLLTAPTTANPAPPPALFQTAPVEWFETTPEGIATNVPKLAPHMFVFQRIGDTTLTLLDFNSNQIDTDFDKNHPFNLVITYDGQTYGSDPVIVNEPPVG